MPYQIHAWSHELCDVWIGGVDNSEVQYCYGGTRLVSPATSDLQAEQVLVKLMVEESGLKNALINEALAAELFNDCVDEFPAGYLTSKVGGGRCILRPKTRELYAIMRDPTQPGFELLISEVFKQVGSFLNQHQGRFKLTPDFGRFAGLADLLGLYTPHSLGIRCLDGGCGGKASYAATGIIMALDHLGLLEDSGQSLTLVGSAGALGSEVLGRYLDRGHRDLAVCDLAYQDGSATPPSGISILHAEEGAFTDECLARGGGLVMTTYGEELARSNWETIPAGAVLVLAHNLSVPSGEAGRRLMRQLAARGVTAIPGQVLTLGGALTSRLEWFWRQAYPRRDFNKPLAHEIVHRVTRHLIEAIDKKARHEDLTPYDAMWDLAGVALVT